MIYNPKDNEHEPEAYETLLLDVMEGNPTLFMRADQVEAAWKIVMPILEAWESRAPGQLSELFSGFLGTGRCGRAYRKGWAQLDHDPACAIEGARSGSITKTTEDGTTRL